METILEQLEFLLRILIAGVCGGMIGYERRNRHKEAGVRTHLLVALASALMMVVSKYGFGDMLIFESVKLDPSRVASGIVSGVGFLGAGMIFIRKHTVNGLTTAAGIWATVGVGMAIGAGMYFIGIATTLLIVLLQVLLHKNLWFLRQYNTEHVCIKLPESGIKTLRKTFQDADLQIASIKLERQEGGMMLVKMDVNFPAQYDTFQLLDLLEAQEEFASIEL